MKNNKRLTTMVITLCALVVLFIAYKAAASMNDQRKRREQAEEAEKTKTVMIADFKYTDATAISYQKKGEEEVSIRKDDAGRWVAASDSTLPINQEKAAYMANALASMGATAVVDPENADVSEFGLDDPAWTFSITYKTDNKKHTYEMGGYNEFSKSYYFREEGVDKIYLIVEGLTQFFDYDLHAITDAGKFPVFTAEKFRSVDITMADRTVHLEGEDITASFIEIHNILQPADFVEYHLNDETLTKHGLKTPTATVSFNYKETVTYNDTEGSSSSSTIEQDRSFVIKIGDKYTAEDGSERYAYSSDGYSFIYSMPASAAETIFSCYSAGETA